MHDAVLERPQCSESKNGASLSTQLVAPHAAVVAPGDLQRGAGVMHVDAGELERAARPGPIGCALAAQPAAAADVRAV